MTAVLDDDTATATVQDDPIRYATWPARAGALLLDVVPGVIVVATMGLLAYTTLVGSWLWWVFMAALAVGVLATLANRWILPTVVGWTMGRAVTGIRVTTPTGEAVSGVRLMLRDLAHILDTAALFVGWLWPLWDKRHRTFADLLLRTEVRATGSTEAPRRDVRRIAGCALIAAAVLCAAGGGLGYVQVYRQDRALEQSRTEIAEQGPRIVEQLLSYGTKSVADDFTRAQSLATDGYRPQLVAQQEAVKKAGVTDNEYWAVSSAVLSVSQDRAAILLALQGQRGSDSNSLKFITATVRADFEKASGRWQVAGLTVLKKPLTGQNGPPAGAPAPAAPAPAPAPKPAPKPAPSGNGPGR